MPISKKFQRGFANTLAKSLFDQYAQEDQAKAVAGERDYQTRRDLAQQMFQREQTGEERDFTRAQATTEDKYATDAAFRTAESLKRHQDKQRENAYEIAKLYAGREYGKGGRGITIGGGDLSEKEYLYLTGQLGEYGIAYEQALDESRKKQAAEMYENIRQTLLEAGYPHIPKLAEIIQEDDNDVVEPDWIDNVFDGLGRAKAGTMGLFGIDPAVSESTNQLGQQRQIYQMGDTRIMGDPPTKYVLGKDPNTGELMWYNMDLYNFNERLEFDNLPR